MKNELLSFLGSRDNRSFLFVHGLYAKENRNHIARIAEEFYNINSIFCKGATL